MPLGLVEKKPVLESQHKSTQMSPKVLPLYSHHPSDQSPPDRARSKSNQDPCSFFCRLCKSSFWNAGRCSCWLKPANELPIQVSSQIIWIIFVVCSSCLSSSWFLLWTCRRLNFWVLPGQRGLLDILQNHLGQLFGFKTFPGRPRHWNQFDYFDPSSLQKGKRC